MGDSGVNIQSNINHDGKNIAIVADNAANPSEIEIKIFAGDGFGVEDLSMFVPISSAKMITQKYLRMCGQKLMSAQEWND